MELTFYTGLLTNIKNRIRHAQIRATLSANAEMIEMYWDIGKMIQQRQQEQGWGATVTFRLANDLKNELPEIKGFSERNLKFMVQFYKTYEDFGSIGKQAVSQLPTDANSQVLESKMLMTEFRKQLVSQIPWGHQILLMQKVKDLPARIWYMQQTIQNGWSRDVMALMIKSQTYERHGEAITNFDYLLPNLQSDLAKQSLKDPYIFDFLTLSGPFAERELESELIKHIEKFLLELGNGFAFMGRQYHLEVGESDFYIDLLFYHVKMRCFVVIDLKKGDFKPEYAGKMNFYCSAVDDLLKHPTDQPTIGLILCENRNRIIAEYTLRGTTKPIGISEFELTRALPEHLKPSLPSIEEIENELSKELEGEL